ncbi:potassium channel family protein [Mongoliitalea daihaiensis]|uniref:potassium channel family protein n=1 Tax=Mongoliitalea daihaiensis TaxID=2782006 RepID=UPI001F289DD3|nr:NAD-binding protein [Mongoliitalea daihaiensis]UJP64863.1 potassium channel protein [Mongoliitalea daihaiensis]
MKILFTQISYFIKNKPDRRNMKLLLKFTLVLFFIIAVFTVTFHYLMSFEGREFSWLTGLYWTLTVMSTLGFGDITFETDLGRTFSVLVLLTGMLFLLILFPFIFINFFYSPWMKAQEQSRVPKALDEGMKGHVILTNYDPVTQALIKKLVRIHVPYVVLVTKFEEGLKLREMDVFVMLGELDDPKTYTNARVNEAALVATTTTDVMNTSVAFTVREVCPKVPIIATCNYPASEDILELAGCNHVLRLGEIMGTYLARRASGGDASAQIIGKFEDLNIAEATVKGSQLVGLKLKETNLRAHVGVSVLGIWERGYYEAASPETMIEENTVLVLAGTEEQIQNYNRQYCVKNPSSAPLVIIGGGRVGRATGRALAARGLDYRIVEKVQDRIKDTGKYVFGDAADYETLSKAGIQNAPCVLISTHEDDVNTYLTIYCRKLRPDIQVITRATYDRNLSTIHRAGADFVLSYASMGSNNILNLLNRSDTLMVAEGLDLIKIKVPESLEGKSIAESDIRKETGCTVIALKRAGGMEVNPDPSSILEKGIEIVLIGTVEAENKFFKEFEV